MPFPQPQLYTYRYSILYLLLALLVIIDRSLLLHHFAFRFVDDDQSVMWYGAKEFATGNFHEPCFFGQAYNSMLESLFAVPLIKMGLDYNIALPLVASFMSMFPFFLISFLAFRNGKQFAALVIISIPLVLPNEFGMITSIPRGFVTGVFCASIACVAFFNNRNSSFIIFGFLSILAFIINPNSVVVLAPVGLYLLLENYKNKKFYFFVVLGAIPAGIIYFFVHQFYINHPENIVHGTWGFTFSNKTIRLESIIKFFNDIVPVFWGMGWMIFPMFFILCFYLFRQKEKKAAIALLSGVVLIVLSLGFSKVNDGYSTVYYSWSRMFIGIPLIFGIFIYKIRFSERANHFIVFLLLTSISFFIVKCKTLPDTINKEVVEKKNHIVYVSSIDKLNWLCDTIMLVSKKYNVDLVVMGTLYEKHLINYGCPCLRSDFPATIEPNLDRRTWRLKEEDAKIRPTILFIGVYDSAFTGRISKLNFIKISNDPLMYVLPNNHLPTSQLLDSLKIPMRRH